MTALEVNLSGDGRSIDSAHLFWILISVYLSRDGHWRTRKNVSLKLYGLISWFMRLYHYKDQTHCIQKWELYWYAWVEQTLNSLYFELFITKETTTSFFFSKQPRQERSSQVQRVRAVFPKPTPLQVSPTLIRVHVNQCQLPIATPPAQPAALRGPTASLRRRVGRRNQAQVHTESDGLGLAPCNPTVLGSRRSTSQLFATLPLPLGSQI